MTETIYKILWIAGTICAALVIGLMLLQFVIWLLTGGVSDDENNRPLFRDNRNHRHPTYPENIVNNPDINVRANRKTRHEQMRHAIGFYTDEQTQRRADKHAEQIAKQYEDINYEHE